jgi:hypothetical protein
MSVLNEIVGRRNRPFMRTTLLKWPRAEYDMEGIKISDV